MARGKPRRRLFLLLMARPPLVRALSRNSPASAQDEEKSPYRTLFYGSITSLRATEHTDDLVTPLTLGGPCFIDLRRYVVAHSLQGIKSAASARSAIGMSEHRKGETIHAETTTGQSREE